MKTISSSIVLVTLLSLVYLMVPGNASAQIVPPRPCCYSSTSTADSPADPGMPGALMLSETQGFTADPMSSAYPINPKASSSGKIFESQGAVQYSSSSEMPTMDREDACRLFVNDRKISFGERS